MRKLLLGVILGCFCGCGIAQSVSPLFARGYTAIPQPQQVSLTPLDFPFDSGWQLKVDRSVPSGDVAVEALRQDLSTRFHFAFDPAQKQTGVLTLRIVPNSVPISNAQDRDRSQLAQQAYRIDLHRDAVTITANASTGLFYGVETLIQLLRPERGALWLPEGTIQDWPDLEQRHIYWDNNHHLETVPEFERAIRQAAFYKINGFVVKLNGHFQYKSAPAVVEPYALSPAQLQHLTDYGLRYHIQLIPYLDGPAHIAFILKHPEYAALREFPESNYELCATNPASYKLLEGMYQDLLDANKGVNYFYLSTDESYYLGLAHNAQCNETDLAAKLGSVGKIFAEYVSKTGGYLHSRGRNVIFWGEYPLKPADISALPGYLINGEVYGAAFDQAFRQQGIRQMIFTSAAGEEKLFPQYFIQPPSLALHAVANDPPRVDDILNKISFDSSRRNSDLIGEIDAGWSDEGIHPETFWLGYVASAAAGWHPGATGAQEVVSTFYPLFYGPQVVDMNRLYQQMSEQAQQWSDTWDTAPTTARKPIWGWSYGIYSTPEPAHDQTLPLPPPPAGDLEYSSPWLSENTRRIALAADALRQNDVLLGALDENLLRASFNRYNLEVYVSIANLYRQNFEMIGGIARMDGDLTAASQQREKDPQAALKAIDRALDTASTIRRQRNRVLSDATATWDKSWEPRVAEANGRHFLYVLDDVKDHLPDRTVDMSYLVYRETILPLGTWVDSILSARNQFAAAHHLPARNTRLLWEDFTVAPSGCTSASEVLADPHLSNLDQAATCGSGN